jgi:hypothetical protein
MEDKIGTFLTPWEGPFVDMEVTRLTSYKLAYLDGTSLPNSWHIDKLRRFVLRQAHVICIFLMIYDKYQFLFYTSYM